MARLKYSEDQRDEILVKFISATREIIETEGVENVTVRKIANIAGCNSAKLYFYFNDLDELITMASMSYLEKYTRTLVIDLQELDDNYEIFLHTWEVFCVYAFNNPVMFNQIFFVYHETSLDDLIREYYRLFPYQLKNLDVRIQSMLLAGPLQVRNREILGFLVDDGVIKADNIDLINELMVSYFFALLKDRILHGGGLIRMQKTKDKFMTGIKYLIDKERL